MARLFGALANAGAQVNTNRFKRQQYDDQQAAQLREEARRALEFKAMRDQAAAQMDLMRQSRQDTLDQRKQEEGRRRDEDIASGIRNGFESAPYEEASSAANAFLQSQGMGMPSQVVKAPRSTRKPIMVEGQDVGAPDLQASPEYTRIGGRLMRYDAQKQANAKAATGASDMMAKFALERVKSKGDIDEILARAGATYHPPPQRRTQIVKDDASGEYVVVDMDQLGPTGLKVPKTGAGGGATATKLKSEEPMRAALKEISSQVLAQAEAGGGLPAPSVMESYLADKKGDYKAGSLSRTLAKAGYAATAGPAMQKAQNFVDQVGSVLLPLRGGKAITQGEKEIIMGAVTVAPGETPEMRAQKLHAFEMLVAPVIAQGGGDLNQVISEMRQRAQAYRPKSTGTTTKQAAPPSMQQGETREQRIKRLSGSR